jgi:transposase-like protein
MTKREHKTKLSPVESLVTEDRDLMKALLRETLEEVLEAEMTEFLGAAAGERTDSRSGYRAGYYSRNWVTRIGKLELRVPRDRNGEFSTALFERYQRSEKALVGALAEMYVQGVSTRKVIGPLTNWSSSSFGMDGNAADLAAIAAFFNFVLLGILAYARRFPGMVPGCSGPA